MVEDVYILQLQLTREQRRLFIETYLSLILPIYHQYLSIP
jgi:hypothetical protein